MKSKILSSLLVAGVLASGANAWDLGFLKNDAQMTVIEKPTPIRAGFNKTFSGCRLVFKSHTKAEDLVVKKVSINDGKCRVITEIFKQNNEHLNEAIIEYYKNAIQYIKDHPDDIVITINCTYKPAACKTPLDNKSDWGEGSIYSKSMNQDLFLFKRIQNESDIPSEVKTGKLVSSDKGVFYNLTSPVRIVSKDISRLKTEENTDFTFNNETLLLTSGAYFRPAASAGAFHYEYITGEKAPVPDNIMKPLLKNEKLVKKVSLLPSPELGYSDNWGIDTMCDCKKIYNVEVSTNHGSITFEPHY